MAMKTDDLLIHVDSDASPRQQSWPRAQHDSAMPAMKQWPSHSWQAAAEIQTKDHVLKLT
jgi:hypothetical protein